LRDLFQCDARREGHGGDTALLEYACAECGNGGWDGNGIQLVRSLKSILLNGGKRSILCKGKL
jgi:hypothetical protein